MHCLHEELKRSTALRLQGIFNRCGFNTVRYGFHLLEVQNQVVRYKLAVEWSGSGKLKAPAYEEIELEHIPRGVPFREKGEELLAALRATGLPNTALTGAFWWRGKIRVDWSLVVIIDPEAFEQAFSKERGRLARHLARMNKTDPEP